MLTNDHELSSSFPAGHQLYIRVPVPAVLPRPPRILSSFCKSVSSVPRVSGLWLLPLTHLLLTCQAHKTPGRKGKCPGSFCSVLSLAVSHGDRIRGIPTDSPEPPFFTVYMHAAPGTVGLWVIGESLWWKG